MKTEREIDKLLRKAVEDGEIAGVNLLVLQDGKEVLYSLTGYSYGNLMRIMEEPGLAYYQTWKGEYGWDGWLGAYFCNSPVNRTTILMSFQRKDAGITTLTRRVRNILASF